MITIGEASGGITVTINHLTIKGGAINTGSANFGGGGVLITQGNTLYLNYCIVSNSRSKELLYSELGGGGICNYGGILFLNHSLLIRNAANYGGGFLNLNGGSIYIENSTLSENRSTSDQGGGGAG